MDQRHHRPSITRSRQRTLGLIALLTVAAVAESQPVTPTDSLGEHLLSAIQDGRTELALQLIEQASSLEVFTSDTTRTGANLLKGPLHLAAQFGRAEVTRELLAAGVDLEMRTANGVTALGYAATYGHAEVARVLLEAGARQRAVYPDSTSALLVAAGNGYYGEYHTPSRGFDPDGHADVFRTLLRAGGRLGDRRNLGGVPPRTMGVLQLAAVSGRVDIMTYVLSVDTSGTFIRDDGVSAFGWAVVSPATPSRAADPLPALRLLYEAGVRPDSVELGRMLMNAARTGIASSSQFLTKVGAPLDYRQQRGDPDSGHTPLTLAARNGHLGVVRVLLSAGADPLNTGVNDWTALEIATRYKRDDVVAYLEEYLAALSGTGIPVER